MQRNSRKKSESGIYHTIMRGINNQIIFHKNSVLKIFDKKSRDNYLRKLKKEGLSVGQLERLTDINRGSIMKA